MTDIESDFENAKWDAWYKTIERNLTGSQIEKVMEALAWKGQKHIATTMPWKTKKTIDRSGIAKSWHVIKKGIGEYQIVSAHKVAFFLEEGTKAHGPKVKKFLYIPLHPGAATWRKGFVYGQDYILVKWVKGIDARHYLKPVSEAIMQMMIDDFTQQIEKVV